MSREVLIPSNTKPYFEITINNTKYSYLSGTTQTVPDEVAQAIDDINNNKPKEYEETEYERIPKGGTNGQYLGMTSNGMKWSDIPTELPSGGSNGQVLKKTTSGTEWGNETTYTLPSASASEIGGVKKADGVANATNATDVINQLNALISSLVASGAIEEYVEPTE